MYVAAYHACRENLDKDGAIWALKGNFLHDQMEKIYGVDSCPPEKLSDNVLLEENSSSETFFIIPTFKTDRMVAQQGLFTVCRNISGNQHEIISSACAEKNNYDFVKMIIPCDMKVEFLRKLRAMNITASSLFPGLDGVGQSVKELVILNAEYPNIWYR